MGLLEPKVFGTKATKDLAELVLYDSLKVGKLKGKPRNFGKNDIKNVLYNWNIVNYKKPFKIGSTKITFHDAGHIPGSAMALIEMSGKKILYTSDFKIEDTQLSLKQILEFRMEKLNNIKRHGINPYPNKFDKKHNTNVFMPSIKNLSSMLYNVKLLKIFDFSKNL